MVRTVLRLLFVFAIVCVAVVVVKNSVKEREVAVSNSPSAQDSATASAVPFLEMTIPYLRAQKYVSRLGELEPYQKKATYDSYLTHYNSGSLRINGLLTKPNGQMPDGGWPAIVFVHGYIPPTLYETTSKYVDYVDYLARNGFVVFKIDLRGHGDSEGEATGAYYSSDYIIDTLNAYQALNTTDFVATDTIGLWGHSMAGNVVLRSMAAQPTIKAGVIWAGAVYSYTDMSEYGLNDNSYRPPGQSTGRQQRRQLLFDTHGVFSPDNEFWQQVAPTNYLQEFKGAVQLHHAVDDDVVNVGYSRDLMKLLEPLGGNHELYEYSGGGHNITGGNFGVAMQRTVEFFEERLK